MKNQKSSLGWENKVPRVVKVLLILLVFAGLSVPYCLGDNTEKATSKNPNIALASPSSGGHYTDSVSPNLVTKATKILKLKVDSEGPSLGLQLVANGEISDYSVIPHDNNIILEIPRVLLEEKQAAIPVHHPLVESIQIDGSNKDRLSFNIKLLKKSTYTIGNSKDGLEMTLFPSEGNVAGIKPTSSSNKATVKGIGFQMLPDGKSEVLMKLSGLPPLTIKKSGNLELSFLFDKTILPDRYNRFLDTSQFISAVNKVTPEKNPLDKNQTLLNINLRDDVPYWIESKGDQLALKFAPSHVPPQKPIELNKPVSLAKQETLVTQKTQTDTSPSPASGGIQESEIPSPSYLSTETQTDEMGAMNPPSQMELPGSEVLGVKSEYTGEPISLDLQGTDLVNVLRLLSDISGTNMIIEPGITGKVTLKVDKVPWDQVLDLILKMNGLGREKEGNIIRIAKLSKLRKEMQEIQKQIRAKQNVLETAQDLGELTQNYLQVNYAKAADIADQIDQIKSNKGTISVDDRTNLIIYSDYPARVKRAREILAQLDKPTPQVLIESRIVQATTSFTRELGINWSGNYDNNSFTWAVNFPVAATTSASLSIGQLLNTSFWALDIALSANEASGNIKVISAPKVLTLDGVEATISQGDEIPYLKQSEDGVSTEFKQAVLELKVTPHITPDQKVRLEISAKKDEPAFLPQTVGDAPAISTRKVDTELLIDSGDTVVIGGIIEDNKTINAQRTPGLSNIPILGLLFRNNSYRREKKELLIFISPRVISQPYFTAAGN